MKAESILIGFVVTGTILTAIAAASPAAAQAQYQYIVPPGSPATLPAVSVYGPGYVAPGYPMAQPGKTIAFVVNVVPNINFLNDASRIALDHSGSPAIRRFARRVASQQTITGNSMTAWAETNGPMLTGRSAYSPGIAAPIVGLAALPLNVVIGAGNVVTGGAIVASDSGHALLRSQAADLARLSTLRGAQFDSLYKQTQMDSLQQLATLYRDYAVNGDDPALRALAQSELPKVNARIAELGRI